MPSGTGTGLITREMEVFIAWIDIGNPKKTPGKAYVALSRVKSLSSCVNDL